MLNKIKTIGRHIVSKSHISNKKESEIMLIFLLMNIIQNIYLNTHSYRNLAITRLFVEYILFVIECGVIPTNLLYNGNHEKYFNSR